MRRKLTAALLTAAMAISLTACGGSGDTASAGASSRSSNTLVTAEPFGPSARRAQQQPLPEKKFSGLQCQQIMHRLTGCRRMIPMEQ